MTVKDIIDSVDSLYENPISQKQKLKWLSDIEGEVITAVLLLDSSEVIEYDETSMAYEMILPPPHDRIYVPYVHALTALALEDTAVYGNMMAVFNAYMDELKCCVASTFDKAIRMSEGGRR